ncbi:MAG: CoA activase, partial [Desulfobacteraceae bacterium]|nr:CoA activase [Desulfobacteraceae bacterium]
YNRFDSILVVGGEKFGRLFFDENGDYLNYKSNTSCAAGTGSFLDQQARRLMLEGSENISRMAIANTKTIPQIATRCAVFAKTDLIHAQQEGYNLEQICDGLCLGLAKNISNTLFVNKVINQNILFCGGVAKNKSVKTHLETLTGLQFTMDSHCQSYGAAGAALCLVDDIQKNISPPKHIFTNEGDFFVSTIKKDRFLYPELKLSLSRYPDFECIDSYVFDGVETDIYLDPKTIDHKMGFVGIDVGSTSTKSIIITENGDVLAGFYTRTASRPVKAVQKIFKACDKYIQDYDLKMEIIGCGTTGSGRRISGKIIGADIEPDEITAHATAAVSLNKDVDTIIEIGGQDAKFTLLENGIVTSSIMNTVCAAGTGSFIEEQALKLTCSLNEYAARTQSVCAPVSSDRCTVFMERDINYYLAEGYKKNEILASVLHSVRDNYLSKVASIGKIGNCILFQGATAKNKALIAAFEQKLEKPIHVSKYCHLTGALGVALMLKENCPSQTRFRGFSLWNKEIPVRQETCDLCTNHCKLTIATIGNETEAYGFLCGRDYDTKKRVQKKNEYDLLKLRKKAIHSMSPKKIKHDFTIGIPAALHLFEDLSFWQTFFAQLGIKTINSTSLENPVKLGKITAAAEFCSPVTALHGHINYLLK